MGAGALRSLAGFNAQNLANSVWAYANLGLSPGEEALDAYARASIERMGEATPQNLVRVWWFLRWSLNVIINSIIKLWSAGA